MRAKEALKPKVKEPVLDFLPRSTPANIDSERIRTSPDKTKYRVEIASQYHKFVKDVRKASMEADAYFDDRLTLAEAQYGSDSAKIYAELFSDAFIEKKDQEEKRRRFQTLGLSLLKSGYTDQGRQVLEYYLQVYGDQLSLETLLSLGQEIIQYEQNSLIEKIVEQAEKKVEQQQDLVQVFIDAYEYYGTFTPKGIRAVRGHFKKTPPTASAFHTLVKDLHKQKLFKTAKEWKNTALNNNMAEQYEKSFTEVQVKGATKAKLVSEFAQDLTPASPLYPRVESMAVKLYNNALTSAHQIIKARIEEWEQDFKISFSQTDTMPVSAFVRGVENTDNANGDFNFSKSLRDDLRGVLYKIATDPIFFADAIEFLDAQEGDLGFLGIYAELAKVHGHDLRPEQISRLIESWKKSLTEACIDISQIDFIEESTFASRTHRAFNYKHDNGERPSSIQDIHLYLEHSILMAELLLPSSDTELKAQGRVMIDSIPSAHTTFFNPYPFMSPKNTFFGESRGGMIHTLYVFDQRTLKAHALIQGAKLDPSNTHRWLEEAYGLLTSIELDDQTIHGFRKTEEVLGRYLELFEAYIAVNEPNKAGEIYRIIEQTTSHIARIFADEWEKIQSLSEADRDKMDSTLDLEWAMRDAFFLEQDTQSRLRAILAKSLALHGNIDQAAIICADLIQAFDREISGRRDRFDVRSMSISARNIADISGFSIQGADAFQMAIAKLALTRGESSAFTSGIELLYTQIIESNLSVEEKDRLLSQLLVEMSPSQKSQWLEMESSLPQLLKISKAISESGNYPQAEFESLKIIHTLAMDSNFSRDDSFSNYASLRALQQIYKFTASNYSEIFAPEYTDDLVVLSESFDYYVVFSFSIPG